MNVFISYGSVGDQVTALRLQALGAVNGLTIYVPPLHTRSAPSAVLDSETVRKLHDAEVVLGITGLVPSESNKLEIANSLAMNKPVMVVGDSALARQLAPPGCNLAVIDPAIPEQAELQMMQYLNTVNTSYGAKRALKALGTLALGLQMLATP